MHSHTLFFFFLSWWSMWHVLQQENNEVHVGATQKQHAALRYAAGWLHKCNQISKNKEKKSIFLHYFLQENCLSYKLHFFRSKPNKTPSYWRQTVHFHDSLKSAYECAESMTAQFVELICWRPELHPGVCRAAALDKKESIITHHLWAS